MNEISVDLSFMNKMLHVVVNQVFPQKNIQIQDFQKDIIADRAIAIISYSSIETGKIFSGEIVLTRREQYSITTNQFIDKILSYVEAFKEKING